MVKKFPMVFWKLKLWKGKNPINFKHYLSDLVIMDSSPNLAYNGIRIVYFYEEFLFLLVLF